MITHIAIKTNDGSVHSEECLYCYSHSALMLDKMLPYRNINEKGFLNDSGDFLSRIEAMQEALQFNQVDAIYLKEIYLNSYMLKVRKI